MKIGQLKDDNLYILNNVSDNLQHELLDHDKNKVMKIKKGFDIYK